MEKKNTLEETRRRVIIHQKQASKDTRFGYWFVSSDKIWAYQAMWVPLKDQIVMSKKLGP